MLEPTPTRIPWRDLMPADRDAITDWCRRHDLDPAAVPIDARIEPDVDAGEWLVEIYEMPRRLGDDGEPVKAVVRRRYRGPLPRPMRSASR